MGAVRYGRSTLEVEEQASALRRRAKADGADGWPSR
jgi:hypothetical protein